MKIGIDSYCFHRLFGEVYAHQDTPGNFISMDGFLEEIFQWDIDGVSLESCFFPNFSPTYLAEVKKKLDERGLDRVYAWGHPDGLEAGGNRQAFDDMIEHIDYAVAIGAKVMRVVASSLLFRFEPHEPQLAILTEWFKEAVIVAEKKGVILAIENHIDYNSDELLKLLQDVDSDYLGINFDSGNFLRVLDDPVKAMGKLAPYVHATHIKDLLPANGVAVDEWYFFSCVPTGKGLIDNYRLGQILEEHNFTGFMAVEIDTLHPDYFGQEISVIKDSIKELRRLSDKINLEAKQLASPLKRRLCL
ncbi:sugar phosphate isomerase/epimerase family protein [Paraglaciecola arctica]|uniref:sugar phosphate isomerase/epimerase family protein n=1 Tax=Paraglaciecola arctica TaxID=1128911 RepID=UPI001C07CA5A|nr:sugar phosphate isomerase/epimerase family protein [Paraglaciecola arctica]MBU3005563.1 sugar phosphate isomerase/epimerase [Paraglaciecola arctica]